MAKKNEEATAPRMSQIERLQQQLAEAQAKAEAREQKKIEQLKQQFEAFVIRQNKASAKAYAIRQELLDLGATSGEIDEIVVNAELVDEPEAE